LLVRTRPGRTELCGDYATGPTLRAASAFAVGGVRTCIRAATDRRHRRALPPALDVRLAPVVERTGWYVDRAAFGVDLYAHARAARLRSGRTTVVAQRHLEQAWAVAREAIAPFSADDDLRDADAMVDGSLRLTLDGGEHDDARVATLTDPMCQSEFGSVLTRRQRPFGSVDAALVSWDLTVLALDGARRGYVAIPRRYLSEVLADLDRGALDSWIGAFLRDGDRGRVLRASSDVREPALFDDIAPMSHLATQEPPPGAPSSRWRPSPGGPGHGDSDRPQKRRRDESPRRPRRVPKRLLMAGAGVAAGVVAVGAVAFAATAGSDDDDQRLASPSAPTVVAPPGATIGPTGARRPEWVPINSHYNDEYFVTHGSCGNGATPGGVDAVSILGFGGSTLPFDEPLPAGAIAFELTHVGRDRYEGSTPAGAYKIDERSILVRADCSGSTPRKEGPSVIDYGVGGWDIANAPITDETPTVIIVAHIDGGECEPEGRVGEAWLEWREQTDSIDFEDGALLAREPLLAQPDGTYRAEIAADRYINELLTTETSESARYRCDFR
jgi:hypothetical protein